MPWPRPADPLGGSSPADAGREGPAAWRVAAVLLATGLAVFANAIGNPFHYDDLHSILYNPHLRSLRQIPAYFLDPGTFSGQQMGFMFRPLLLMSYAINWALGGPRAEGFRLVNLLLHVGCAALVFLLAHRLGISRPTAAAAAGLFLLHPTHAEPVNYISSRSDLLVALLILAVVVLVLSGRTGVGVLALAAALLSKEVAVVAPGLLLLCQYLRDGLRRVWAGRGVYLAMTAVVAAYLAVLWLNRFLASSAAKSPRDLDAQVWTQVKGTVYYLWLFAMPVRLTVEHPFTVSVTLADLTVILSLLLLVSLGFWAWRAGRSLPGLGLAWFGLALLPASLVPLNILVSERRAYLAGIGLVLVAAWAWERLPRGGPLGRVPLGLVAAALCAVLCLQRNAVWASELTLWEDAARKGPGMHRARLNLAVAYDHAGKPEAALRELQAGLALQPEYADGWVIAGNLRLDQGEVAKAEQAYRRALGLNPSLAGVHHNLGNILFRWREDAAAAIPEYEACLRLDPFFVRARNNLGQAYEAVGRLPEAREEYRSAAADSLSWDDGARDPERGGAWYNLGTLERRLGDRGAAVAALSRALPLLESHPEYAVYAEKARVALREMGP